MTTPNAPILNKILEKLDSIDTRLTTLETRFTTLETRFTTLETRFTTLETRFTNFEKKVNGYIKNESDIQELHITQHIKISLEDKFPVSIFEIVPFKNFYIPTSKDHITDVDGCILRRSESATATNMLGRNHILSGDSAYIIEAKHSLTKQQVDKKLAQFCLILKTLQELHSGRIITKEPPSTPFDTMAAMLEVYEFPTDILFIFASDDINNSLLNFIQHINSGTMTDEFYNEYLFKSIKESTFISTIILDPSVRKLIKHMVHQSSTLNELIGIFTQKNLTTTSSKKEQSFELQKASLKPYQKEFFSMLNPFSSVAECYHMLKGKLGVYRMNTLVHP